MVDAIVVLVLRERYFCILVGDGTGSTRLSLQLLPFSKAIPRGDSHGNGESVCVLSSVAKGSFIVPILRSERFLPQLRRSRPQSVLSLTSGEIQNTGRRLRLSRPWLYSSGFKKKEIHQFKPNDRLASNFHESQRCLHLRHQPNQEVLLSCHDEPALQ
jgi:hypothetical protein